MLQNFLNVSKIPRQSKFPVQLQGIFFCLGHRLIPSSVAVKRNWFEVSLRLYSSALVCHDVINGVPVAVSFPNAAWKMPGTASFCGDGMPRDAVSLLYPAETVSLFNAFDMIPEEKCFSFSLNPKITHMAQRFRDLADSIYSPGAADELDWLGFCLIKEALLNRSSVTETKVSPEVIVKNISAWIKLHCCEDIDLMELIRHQGISHTLFYREWHKHFNETPHQEILQERLNVAARMLTQTDLPVIEIIKTVRFSGTYAFYRSFMKKFGVPPGEYRKNGIYCKSKETVL